MYSDNCPKSIDDLLVYPSCTAFFSRETALSDLPHSRQTRLARGVISPQDGHILCGRTSWTSGLTIASSLPRNSRAEASRRRRVGRYGSINFTFAGIPLIGPSPTTWPWQDTIRNSVQDCSHCLDSFSQLLASDRAAPLKNWAIKISYRCRGERSWLQRRAVLLSLSGPL